MAGTKIKVKKKKNAFNACGYVSVENKDHIISHGITGEGSAATPDQWLSTEDKLYDWVLRSSDTDWKTCVDSVGGRLFLAWSRDVL